MALPKAECEQLARDLLVVLGPEAHRIVRMEVGPVEDAAESVPVMIEFVDIPPAWVVVDPGTKPLTILRTQPSEIEPAVPASGRVEGAGPHRVSLGACGLAAGIDFDGSWWDPIGEVDARAPEASGPALGAVVLTSPDVATFRTDSGFGVDMVRHVGPKWLAGCG